MRTSLIPPICRCRPPDLPEVMRSPTRSDSIDHGDGLASHEYLGLASPDSPPIPIRCAAGCVLSSREPTRPRVRSLATPVTEDPLPHLVTGAVRDVGQRDCPAAPVTHALRMPHSPLWTAPRSPSGRGLA